jgi:galactokinase/mevalonate kinase-like predicted kinase
MTRIHDAMFRGEEERAFKLLQEGLTESVLQRKSEPRKTTYDDQIVWGRSAVRIDLAGGWTDTPPYSLMTGGNVVNLAIELNGQQPLQVYIKPSKEPVIICRSIDLGAIERIETYEELRKYNKVGSPFSIPKAALTLAGFMPNFGKETFSSLKQQLEAFGCGIEITLLSAIPAGSGLGTSSILAATVLGALSDFCGLGWDKSEICNRTLVLEQLLTTGGGWQDQYGGVFHGVKLLQTQDGFDQGATVRWAPDTLFTSAEYRPCHLLYYTGVTRTAKNILAEIVRGMFLNSAQHLTLLDEMKNHALAMYDTLQLNDINKYGALVRHTWEQNKALDAGTNPPVIEEICRRIDDLCAGYKLPGAGGGGFMYMVAKDQEAAQRIRTILSQNPVTHNARFVDMSVSTSGLQVSRS